MRSKIMWMTVVALGLATGVRAQDDKPAKGEDKPAKGTEKPGKGGRGDRKGGAPKQIPKEKLAEAFKQADEDSDGFLTKPEFTKALASAGLGGRPVPALVQVDRKAKPAKADLPKVRVHPRANLKENRKVSLKAKAMRLLKVPVKADVVLVCRWRRNDGNDV